jgi:hypothetical protein
MFVGLPGVIHKNSSWRNWMQIQSLVACPKFILIKSDSKMQWLPCLYKEVILNTSCNFLSPKICMKSLNVLLKSVSKYVIKVQHNFNEGILNTLTQNVTFSYVRYLGKKHKLFGISIK